MNRANQRRVIWTWILIFITSQFGAASAQNGYFAIKVADEETGRGVPLVELKTTNDIRYYTDSNGLVAFDEPGLMNHNVYFHVKSHGYEFPKDGFGNRGKAFVTTPGKTEILKIKRLNVAERLYRITGEGIYRDTVLLGLQPPTRAPVLNGQVMGQDTVIVTPYREKLYWFWGDTDKPAYPLGNFAVTGAASDFPSKGGLSPAVGINLTYFTDASGFAKKMCPIKADGLVWIEGVFTVRDPSGRERMLATYTRQNGLSPPLERGLALFNDQQEVFEPLVQFADKAGHDSAHPFRVQSNNKQYWYLFSDWRVLDDWHHATNEYSYETFSCIKTDDKSSEANATVERDGDGRAIYRWRQSAPRFTQQRQQQFVRSGVMKPEDLLWQMRDLDSDTAIPPSRGSVCWNEARHAWIMICSVFGTVWISQADTPTGPWAFGRKIVTHDNYTFYNPTQHSFFDENGGRTIYFEGTYTDSFSGAKERTPRYNYNQIMYRLSLDDPRTFIPKTIYRVKTSGQSAAQTMALPELERNKGFDVVAGIDHFEMPTDGKSGQTTARTNHVHVIAFDFSATHLVASKIK